MLSEEGKLVKQELENFNQAKRRLRNLQDELESWRRLDGVIKSSSLEQQVSGGETIAFPEKRLLKIEELENLISDAIDKALELEDKFLRDIATLDALSQNLLMERYMTGKSLNRIIKDFNYSRAQVFRLYDVSFEKLASRSKDETK